MSFQRRPLFLLPLIVLVATSAPAPAPAPAQAQNPNDWAMKMFDSLSHDFGVVAKGTEVTHRFKVTNLYQENVAISNAQASCGCTTPKFDPTPIKTGQSTYIDISMDTNRFQREKSSNVTITFSQPFPAQVVIPVKVYIRTDIEMTPGSINFGAVGKGIAQERKIDLVYVGDPNWTITKVVSPNKHLQARVQETGRQNGQVNYELIVGLLPDTPVGNLRQELTLVTNDQAGQIPVLVQGRVEADVTITPSVVQLGTVPPGGETVKTVLLRGHNPFVIEKVECESSHGSFKMPQLTKDSKTIHVISLTFAAPKAAGPVNEKFIVTIAGRPEPVTFTAIGVVQAPQAQALQTK